MREPLKDIAAEAITEIRAPFKRKVIKAQHALLLVSLGLR